MDSLLLDIQGEIATLQLNRPKSLNALDTHTLQELKKLIERLSHKEKIKCLIITGAGNKTFCAGADIVEMHHMDNREIADFCLLGQAVVKDLEKAPFLTIAALNGYALGGGLEIALGCDLIIAASHVSLAMPEIKLGLIPGFYGISRLKEAIGTRLAKELIFSGKILSAERAYEIGLVNKVCSQQDLIKTCMEEAHLIIQYSLPALIHAKKAFSYGPEQELEQFLGAFATQERKDAMNKFIDRNK